MTVLFFLFSFSLYNFFLKDIYEAESYGVRVNDGGLFRFFRTSMQTPESMKNLAKEFILEEIYNHNQEGQEIYWERNEPSKFLSSPFSATNVRVYQEEEEEEQEQERYLFWERNYKRQNSLTIMDNNNNYCILEESSNDDQEDQENSNGNAVSFNLVPMHTITTKVSKKKEREKRKNDK